MYMFCGKLRQIVSYKCQLLRWKGPLIHERIEQPLPYTTTSINLAPQLTISCYNPNKTTSSRLHFHTISTPINRISLGLYNFQSSTKSNYILLIETHATASVDGLYSHHTPLTLLYGAPRDHPDRSWEQSVQQHAINLRFCKKADLIF